MKKTSFIVAFVAATLVSFKTMAPATWDLDGFHSQLRFSISLLGLSDIEGTFKIKEATITAPKDDFTDATVTMTADVNTIDTDNDDRDKHLKTADFFDAEKFPAVTFKSTSFKKVADGKYKVTGDLSFHGITKTVTLDAVAREAVHPVTNKTMAGFRVSTIIKRSDFGIAPTTPAAMLSDEVNISANVQFAKK
jgi:polyisoprenoid-binding protein YceI